ncbi:MAG: hypothetical protein CL875_04060 [Dehalococcoidales bacterium]|nr:hypothetical protein [Dehalococcoidales bacterium]
MPGICCLAGEVPDQDRRLQSMAESMKHEDWHLVDRYRASSCGIARVHLRIFNPEPQPIFNEDRSRLIFFDGKIYDYEDERKNLQRQGHIFNFTNNDAEFCLHLYEELGKDFVKQLNGTFAIAIYDIKQQKLLVVNDRYGLRPLYYAVDGTRVLIASEVKAMLQIEPKSKLNDEAIADWFFFGKLLGNKTFFKNVNILPPASILEYSDGKLHIEKYWDFEFDETTNISDDELAEGLASSFRKSVARRLTGNHRYGLALSGGLDSRAIAAAMDDNASQVKAFTFGVKGCDEVRIAHIVAEKLGMKHHIVELNPDELPPHFKDVVYLSDGMDYIGISFLPIVYEEYRKHIDVLFHGLEGDVLLGEYFLDSNLLQARSEEEIVQALYHSACTFPENMRLNLLKPAYYSRIKDMPLNSLKSELQQTRGNQPGNRATHFAIRSVIWRTDLMGCVIGRNKVEEAYPFFDNDFVDWLQRIPPTLRLNYRVYRLFLKKLSPSLAGVTRQLTGVPADAPLFLTKAGVYYHHGKAALKPLIYRLSAGNIYIRNTFGYISLNELFLVNKTWRKAIQDIIADEFSLSREYLNIDYVKQLLAEHGKILPPWQITSQQRFTANYSTPLSFIAAFELFLRLFVK